MVHKRILEQKGLYVFNKCVACGTEEPMSWCSTEKFFFCNVCGHKFSKKGKMIVFEGLDCSGKSTYIQALKEKYEKEYKVKMFDFPNKGTFYGDLIESNRYYTNKKDIMFQVNNLHSFFVNDKLLHKDEIEQYLYSGYIVLIDRYFHSSFVYLMAFYGFYKIQQHLVNYYEFYREMEYYVHGIPEADLTIFLDVDFDVIKKRLLKKKVKDIYEDEFIQETALSIYKLFLFGSFKELKINKFWNRKTVINKISDMIKKELNI